MPQNHSMEIEHFSDKHMFRHLSEIQKQLKGGYLKGRIKLPRIANFRLEITLTSIKPEVEGKELNINPNLLFLAKKKNNRAKKRKRNDNSGEEDDDETMPNRLTLNDRPWKIVLMKKGDQMYHVRPSDGKEIVLDCLERSGPDTFLVLDTDKLMISILAPLQRKGNKAIDVRSLLEAIKKNDPALVQDWSVDELFNLFVKGKKVNMNELKIRFKIFDENNKILTSLDTLPISNTKHKSTVPLQVDQAWTKGNICSDDGSHFFILLKNPTNNIFVKLVLMKDDMIVMHECQNNLDLKPIYYIKHGVYVHANIPKQPKAALIKAQELGYSIGIHLSRDPSDTSFTKPVPIPYVLHDDSNLNCPCSYSDFFYDSNDKDKVYGSSVADSISSENAPFTPDSAVSLSSPSVQNSFMISENQFDINPNAQVPETISYSILHEDGSQEIFATHMGTTNDDEQLLPNLDAFADILLQPTDDGSQQTTVPHMQFTNNNAQSQQSVTDIDAFDCTFTQPIGASSPSSLSQTPWEIYELERVFNSSDIAVDKMTPSKVPIDLGKRIQVMEKPEKPLRTGKKISVKRKKEERDQNSSWTDQKWLLRTIFPFFAILLSWCIVFWDKSI